MWCAPARRPGHCRSTGPTSPARPARRTRTSTRGSAATTPTWWASRGSDSTSRKPWARTRRRQRRAPDLDFVHGESAQGRERGQPADARGHRRRGDQSRDRVARGAGTITEYFLAEYPPRRRDDSLSPEQVGQGHPRPALLGAGTAATSTCPSDDVTLRHQEDSTLRIDRRGGFGKERDRMRVAQLAARLIVEHGLADWTLAKRKAARQLMLPDTAMPSNEEIEAALVEHHALFGGEAHEANLRSMRAQALQWMDRLARVAAVARRRRRGGMGHRAQRHPSRARGRRSEGRGNATRRTRRRVRRVARTRGRCGHASHDRIANRKVRGAIRLAILTPAQRETVRARPTSRVSTPTRCRR